MQNAVFGFRSQGSALRSRRTRYKIRPGGRVLRAPTVRGEPSLVGGGLRTSRRRGTKPPLCKGRCRAKRGGGVVPPVTDEKTSSAPVYAPGHLPCARGRLRAAEDVGPCEAEFRFLRRGGYPPHADIVQGPTLIMAPLPKGGWLDAQRTGWGISIAASAKLRVFVSLRQLAFGSLPPPFRQGRLWTRRPDMVQHSRLSS